jgi:predicted CopG family antitoxin
LPNGNWQIPIDEGTWRRLQKLRLRGESISECIIRVIIVTQLKRGLL